MRTILFLSALLLLGSTVCRSQTSVRASDNLAFDVDSVGRLSIYSTQPYYYLASPHTSFLTVAIDSTVYTNNDRLPNLSHNPWQWKKADVRVDDDTIVCVWPVSSDVTITQKAYPILYQGSYIVVLRFYAKNATFRPHVVRSQYLLNVETGGAQPAIYSEQSGGTVSSTFYIDSLKYRPFFFSSKSAAFQVPNAYVQGVWGDPTLDLKKAWRVTVDDWSTLSSTLLGPSGSSTGDYADAAVLNEWAAAPLAAGASLELGSMAYGPASPFVCGDSPYPVISFADRTVNAKDSNARTILESFVLNGSDHDFLSTTLRLQTSSPLRIDRTSRVTSGDPTRTFGGIEPHLFRIAAWTLAVDPSTVDTTLEATLSLEGRGQSSFDCTDTVTVRPWIKVVYDTEPPIVQTSRSGAYDTSACNARTVDVHVSDTGKGMYTISASSLNNFKIAIDSFSVGDEQAHYRIAVIDSMKDGDAVVDITDVARNVTTETYHYCTIPDNLKPSLGIQHNVGNAVDIILTDDRAWDRGLDSAHILTNVTNARLSVIGVNQSPMPTLQLRATAIDPSHVSAICIKAYDVAGNGPVDTCITFGPTADVTLDAKDSITIAPNPAHERLTVTPGAEPIARVSILDLLGKSMLTVTPGSKGPIEIDLTSLSSGFYIVRIATIDRVISRRIEVIR